MSPTLTPAEVLDELGTMFLFDIATTLRKAGVRGRQNNPWSCPIANYVAQRTGQRITIGPWGWTPDPGYTTDTVLQPLPRTLPGFITAVDAGLYPDLLEEEQ